MKYDTTFFSVRTALLVVGLCLIGTMGYAQTLGSLYNSDSQNGKIGIEKGTDLEQALNMLEHRFNVVFLYRTDALEGRKVKKSKFLPNNVQEALDHLLEGQRLESKYLNPKTYGIYTQTHSALKRQEAIILETVSGQVSDAASGEPLPGVNVVVKGTTTGTSTDSEGGFELNVPSLQDTLVFSFIGYQTQEVPINGRTNIEVALQTQAVSGEELVVVGYGTQQRKDLTGSVSSVGVEDFESGFNSNPEQLVQGKAAGVQINQASGAPGAQSRVRIRGTGSINAGNSPLYVIDGMPIDNNANPIATTSVGGQSSMNPLSTINPSDIESIEILKDASATAIYGARGANGVIIITTKDGREGFSVNYNGYVGIQDIANKLDLLGPMEYVSVMNGIAEMDGESPVFTQSEIGQIGSGTDWQEEIYRTAPVQNHQISFSRGIEDTRYYVSFNMFNQDGLVVNSNMRRYNGRFNIEHQSGDNINFGLKFTTSLIENERAPQGTGTNEFAGVIGAALEWDPTYPIYNSEGEYIRHSTITIDNPMALSNGVSQFDRTNRTIGNAYVEYDIMENWSAKLNFGTDRQNIRSDAYSSTLTIAGEGAGGIADVVNSESNDYVADFTTNYQTVFNDIHDLSILGGITYQKFINRYQSSEASGFPSDATKTDNLSLGSRDTYLVNTNSLKNTLLSYLGRLNYSLNNKYLLTATFRADGSSRFGSENRYGFFPSFALGWRLSDEPFMADLDFLNNLKLRASWGITGNQEIGNFNYLQTLGSGGSAVFGDQVITTVSPQRLPNPNLKWEETTQVNLGVDFSLVDDRLSGSIDWYEKDTDDLLLNLPIPSTSGYSSILSNVGSVKNSGWEFVLESRNITGSKFSWSTSGNVTFMDNEVADLGPIPEIIHGSGGGFISQIALIRPGEPLNAYYGWEIDGVFQQGDDIVSSAQPNAEPGYWKFKDQNNDGTINSDDKTIIGSPHPDFTFGLTNTFNYQRFSLNVFLRGVLGNEKLNSNRLRAFHPISSRRNRLAEPLLNRWTPENPSSRYPSGANLGIYAGGGTTVHTETVEDASFLRLQNVTLRYQIPTESMGFVQNASVHITGQNLLTITDYSGYDPEVSSYGNSDVLVDYNSYPFARTFQLGIDITF
ncbi:SusC/RagA family TonB-linked outer membrane protein [Halalkalibaculum sp. DA384]|uniref:SusC/RagA family TonB-linked outer membrane protein n=1 Tax=Halalkalibaculum sp. DA384 TaxID=3373606 RepID=UPI003754CEBF